MEESYDVETRRRLESELDIKIYPGTEVMTDVGSLHFAKARGKSERVLIPQPTADIHDPLNWNKFWKANALFWAILAAFTQGFGPLAIAPMIPQLMEAFDTDLTGVLQFVANAILVLGFSNYFWMPLHNSFGRRAVMLASTAVALASSIWRARANSYGSFMAASILSGIGAGPAETLIPVIITDVTFLHERGLYQTIYFTAYYTSAMSSTIIAGPMAHNTGWRSFWWFNSAILVLTMVGLIFLFPETRWPRVHAIDHQATEEKVGEYDVSHAEPLKSATAADSQHSEGARPEPELGVPVQDLVLGKGRPSRSQLMPWSISEDPVKTTLIELWLPWKMAVFPIVELAAFIIGWSSSSYLTTNLTQSEVFAAPPYGFSSQKIGLFNLAPMIGALIGLATNGYYSDWLSMRATVKNRYIREPEMRLPAMLPYAVIAIISNFVIAFGYQYKWDWKIIVIIGYTMSGIQVAAIPSIIGTYAVDSYKRGAGNLFLTITVVKALWCYGLSKWLTPFIIQHGYVKPIMLNMSLYVLWLLVSIPFYYHGKTFRKWTAESSVHRE